MTKSQAWSRLIYAHLLFIKYLHIISKDGSFRRSEMRVTVSISIDRRRKLTNKERIRIKSLMRAVLSGTQTLIDGESGWNSSSGIREEDSHNPEFKQPATRTMRSEIEEFR